MTECIATIDGVIAAFLVGISIGVFVATAVALYVTRPTRVQVDPYEEEFQPRRAP